MLVVRLALAGDTMLGRLVAERVVADGPASLFAPEVVAATRDADLFVLNLECCISERGEPVGARQAVLLPRAARGDRDAAPPGVDCVTLANNHALDYGASRSLTHSNTWPAAGIAVVGAGTDKASARRSAVLERDGFRLAVLGVADHPRRLRRRGRPTRDRASRTSHVACPNGSSTPSPTPAPTPLWSRPTGART